MIVDGYYGFLCRQHLLICHLHLHIIYSRRALLKPTNQYKIDIGNYHDKVVKEMILRGYKHTTPMPEKCLIPWLPELHLQVLGEDDFLIPVLNCDDCVARFQSSIPF